MTYRGLRMTAVVFILAIGACGGGSSSGPTTLGAPGASPSAGSAATSTGAGNLGGQSIEVAAVWTGSEQANFQTVMAAFTQKTGVKVTFTSTGDEIATVLGTRLQGGSPPDVALLPQPGLLNDLAAQNALKPIDDVAGQPVDTNFAPIWRQLGSANGHLYGVWFKAANKSTFWYNTKVYKDAGATPPATWADLLTVAQRVQAFGVAPFSIGGADGWTLTDWFENVYLRTAGPDSYDKLTKHEIPWTDASVKSALTTLAQVFGKPDLLAGGTTGALQTDFTTSVANVFNDPAKAGMVYEGDFVAGVIKSDTKAKLGADADFFDFPSVNGSPLSVVGGGDVAVMLKDNPAARALIQYLASPESAAVWAPLGGFTSPNKSVDPKLYPDDQTRKSARALTTAATFRFDMSDLEPASFGGTKGQGEWKLLQDFLATPADIDAVTTKLEAAAAAAFKK